jgi:hypothetical protein
MDRIGVAMLVALVVGCASVFLVMVGMMVHGLWVSATPAWRVVEAVVYVAMGASAILAFIWEGEEP